MPEYLLNYNKSRKEYFTHSLNLNIEEFVEERAMGDCFTKIEEFKIKVRHPNDTPIFYVQIRDDGFGIYPPVNNIDPEYKDLWLKVERLIKSVVTNELTKYN